MAKLQPTKPILVLLYGLPGSGKTAFARQISDELAVAHVQGDRIRAELFENPTYSKEENHIVASLMTYMATEFLKAGVSVIFDTNAMRAAHRRALRNVAQKIGADTVLVWLQIDPDSAFNRAARRDKRKQDDRFAQEMTPEVFRQMMAGMQNPEILEKHVVLSGKHVFTTQRNAFFRTLRERRLIDDSKTTGHVSKPGLVNIVPMPAAGRVDMTRRNVIIR